jgi:hypothetical protein
MPYAGWSFDAGRFDGGVLGSLGLAPRCSIQQRRYGVMREQRAEDAVADATNGEIQHGVLDPDDYVTQATHARMVDHSSAGRQVLVTPCLT